MKSAIQSIHSRYTARLRRRRSGFFAKLLEGLEGPLRILDCGGTVEFWQNAGMIPLLESRSELTIVNLFEGNSLPPHIKWCVGDVRHLSKFRDGEFDVVFSNAVLNVMPSWEDQCRMAQEVRRVGKRYFIQSPNRYFPVDWRTLVPFFHFLSPELQAWCFTHFRVGVYARVADRAKAYSLATRVRDLSVSQMQELFPGCRIFRERCFSFTKSIAAYGGWS